MRDTNAKIPKLFIFAKQCFLDEFIAGFWRLVGLRTVLYMDGRDHVVVHVAPEHHEHIPE